MKLNATPRHYMPLSQNQSDDDESGPSKEDKGDKLSFKNSFDASEGLSKGTRPSEVEVDTKTLPMSPLRILMFILSLIMCVLFVVVFVFFLPCSMPSSLDATCHLNYKWKSFFHNMSFISPLDFVHAGFASNHLIIFGYLNDESGLIAVEASSGKEYWKLPLHSTPSLSICNTIDVNLDGIPECLIIGNNGLLTAVDVEKGISLWYLHNHSNLNEADSVYGPMIVADCDGDGILDILISYNISSDNSIYLALVSGGTGQIIGSLLELPECTGPVTASFSWDLQNRTGVVLFCSGQKNGNLWMLQSKSVCDVALNETRKLPMKKVFRVPQFVKDIQFYKVSDLENHLVIVLDGLKFILLEISSHFNFQSVWKVYFEPHQHMRIFTDGQFVKGSRQLVISSTYMSHSKIIGLSLEDGREVWSFTNANATVTSAVKLPKLFGDTDGLILKTLSLPFSQELIKDKNFRSNASKPIVADYDKKEAVKSSIRLLEENYILVKCGKIPLIRTINTEESWSYCDGTVCQPDIYTTNATVLVTSTIGTSFDMVQVTPTVLPVYNASIYTEDIVMKYLNVESILSFPRCSV